MWCDFHNVNRLLCVFTSAFYILFTGHVEQHSIRQHPPPPAKRGGEGGWPKRGLHHLGEDDRRHQIPKQPGAVGLDGLHERLLEKQRYQLISVSPPPAKHSKTGVKHKERQRDELTYAWSLTTTARYAGATTILHVVRTSTTSG